MQAHRGWIGKRLQVSPDTGFPLFVPLESLPTAFLFVNGLVEVRLEHFAHDKNHLLSRSGFFLVSLG